MVHFAPINNCGGNKWIQTNKTSSNTTTKTFILNEIGHTIADNYY